MRAVEKELEFVMLDRRLVTDFGLALLIAFPAALPAAPTPWSSDDDAAKPAMAFEQIDREQVIAERLSKDQGRS